MWRLPKREICAYRSECERNVILSPRANASQRAKVHALCARRLLVARKCGVIVLASPFRREVHHIKLEPHQGRDRARFTMHFSRGSVLTGPRSTVVFEAIRVGHADGPVECCEPDELCSFFLQLFYNCFCPSVIAIPHMGPRTWARCIQPD
jgi:hypothetical protein